MLTKFYCVSWMLEVCKCAILGCNFSLASNRHKKHGLIGTVELSGSIVGLNPGLAKQPLLGPLARPLTLSDPGVPDDGRPCNSVVG